VTSAFFVYDGISLRFPMFPTCHGVDERERLPPHATTCAALPPPHPLQKQRTLRYQEIIVSRCNRRPARAVVFLLRIGFHREHDEGPRPVPREGVQGAHRQGRSAHRVDGSNDARTQCVEGKKHEDSPISVDER
jgi:hypothetical protein